MSKVSQYTKTASHPWEWLLVAPAANNIENQFEAQHSYQNVTYFWLKHTELSVLFWLKWKSTMFMDFLCYLGSNISAVILGWNEQLCNNIVVSFFGFTHLKKIDTMMISALHTKCATLIWLILVQLLTKQGIGVNVWMDDGRKCKLLHKIW